MESYSNNSPNDSLWSLLENPANDVNTHAYNLQRLVNDFPQSGILQALLAHASDQKNLKRASVYFSPRALFKLINAPSSFTGVPDERIIVQAGMGDANGSPGYYEAPAPSYQPGPYETAYAGEELEVDKNAPDANAPIAFASPDVIDKLVEDHGAEENQSHFTAEPGHEGQALNEDVLPATENHTEDASPAVEEGPTPGFETESHEQFTEPPPIPEETEAVSSPVEEISQTETEAIRHDVTAEEVSTHETIENTADVSHDTGNEMQREFSDAVAEPAAEVHENGAEVTASEHQAENRWQYDEPPPVPLEPVEQIREPAEKLPEHFEEPGAHAEPPEEKTTEPVALAEPVKEEIAPSTEIPLSQDIKPEPQLPVSEDIDETYDEIVGIEDIKIGQKSTGSFFSFDQEFGAHEDTSAVEAGNEPVAEVVQQEEHQDVSQYHDEKMPYTFLWWLDKTRKEHAQTYQPYVKPPARPVKKVKKAVDALQQQYIENIFHITSVEELDKSTSLPPVTPDLKKKEQVIIERFIREEPQIKPQSSDKLDNENKAKRSSEDRDELVSETLAAIYSDQMLYHKAISSYKKLMLKFPEKSRYFAEKIEQLEKKTN